MNTKLLRRWTAAGLAAALSLCGCGGAGAGPSGMSASLMPTSSASPSGRSPSASPSPIRTGPLTTGPGVLPGEKPPTEPQLATVHSDAGAYAFATYFIRALSWSIATNDSWLLQSVGSVSCTACMKYRDGIENLRRDGKTQLGGRPSIVTSRRLFGHLPGGAEVAIEYVINESAATVLPTHEKVPAHSGARSIVYLVWHLTRWLVNEVAGA